MKQNSHPKTVDTFSLANPAGKSVTALYVGKDRIFAGTADDKIFVLDKKTKNLLHHFQLPEVSYNVRSLCLYHPDTLWMGTGAGLWWLNLKNYSTGKINIDPDLERQLVILLLYTDTKGKIWILESDGVYFFDRPTATFQLINNKTDPLFRTNATSIAEDGEGNIWMAGDAIVRWNILTRRIDTLIEHLPGQKNMRKGYHVMADSKRDIWSTVTDDGLVNLTRSLHQRPKNLLIERGTFVAPTLLNDKIFMSTATGPGYFDIMNGEGVLFTGNDGVPDEMITSYDFISDPVDGSVWFGCKNIICRLPLISSTKKLMTPSLYLTALAILNDTVINYPSQKIRLKHNQEDINILYSAINYADPQNMRFSYRIKNKKDSSWIEAGNQQNILLTNISPGKYKLELRVSAFDNKWKERIKEIEITIKPPFWRTAVFFISIALALLIAGWYLYRYRIKQVKQKANIDKQITELEIKGLHAQMNPHFIFNCLNSIREMILHNENQQASHYLSKFAQLIRITLNQSSKQFITLNDTIDYLQRYAEMEKIRNNKFEYTIQVDDELQTDELTIPPMLIQPFVENAIWHGSVPGKQLQINIRFKKEGNQLVCSVEDNGPGIEATINGKKDINHNSIGIANVSERIKVLNEKYKLNSELSIEDKSKLGNGTGTIVQLYFPLKSIVS